MNYYFDVQVIRHHAVTSRIDRLCEPEVSCDFASVGWCMGAVVGCEVKKLVDSKF